MTSLRGRWRRTSLATRLLVGQMVVVLASVTTAALVAALVGPSIFRRHMMQTSPLPSASEIRHMEEAFRDAGTIALLAGLVSALAVAGVVAWYIGRRIRTSLHGITHAAGEVAAGRYDVDLPDQGGGKEFDELATAFNTMAGTIRHTEDTRRRLLTDVGHELRTPLATMSTHLDGLEDGIIDWVPETQRLFRDQVERMSALARDITAVSRAEEGAVHLDLAPVDLADVVEAARQELAAAYADKAVHLVVDATDADRTVRADPARIGQVLVNLLANALRHTPEGGRVTVTVRPATDAVSIDVADTGEGIAGEQLPHIFERFYRGSSARAHDHLGSGVGLTISQALVREHGGTLTAASAGPGAGSTFALWLPRDPSGSN